MLTNCLLPGSQANRPPAARSHQLVRQDVPAREDRGYASDERAGEDRYVPAPSSAGLRRG